MGLFKMALAPVVSAQTDLQFKTKLALAARVARSISGHWNRIGCEAAVSW